MSLTHVSTKQCYRKYPTFTINNNNNNNNNNKRALVVRQYTKMSSSAVQQLKHTIKQ